MISIMIGFFQIVNTLLILLTIGGFIYVLYGLSRHLKLSRERNELLKDILKATTQDNNPQL